MQLLLNNPLIQELDDSLFEEKELKVFVLRLDLVHPFISGNKWYKLKYNLEEFQRQNKEFLVTFGGAYSNHLVATAAAGKEIGFKTIGIIRGEELNEDSNECLTYLSSSGMKLIFVTREDYRHLRENNLLISSLLTTPYAKLYVLPEGGSNELAVKGCEEIVKDIAIDFDCICCACGTGTTLAGMVSVLKTHQQAIGISVLTGEVFLEDTVKKFSGSKKNFQIIHNYHFGGYARSTEELEAFCKSFTERNNIPIEPVYTGKLFFGIYDLVRKDYFDKGKRVVVVHSGGRSPS